MLSADIARVPPHALCAGRSSTDHARIESGTLSLTGFSAFIKYDTLLQY